MKRRTFLIAAAASPSVRAKAPAWPSRPVTLVVPYVAGGTNDIIARAVAARMSSSLHQGVVVVNRPGAGGTLGAQFVARAPADGYTLLIAPSAVLAISPWVYRQPGYDAEEDFAPITLAGKVANVLLVRPDMQVRDAGELVQLAKRHPRMLSYASMGSGTIGHLCGEMLEDMTGVELQHVPYTGSAAALRDLLGGFVDMMFDNMPTALPLVRAGKLRALAVTSAQRSPMLPDVPALAESGVRGFEATAWFGFVAPDDTPPAILERLNAEMVRALNDPEVHGDLTRDGVEVVASSRAEFGRFIAAESRKWRLIAQKSGARVE